MEGNDAARDDMRQEAVEILLGACIGVIAVNPEEPDGLVPGGRDVRRRGHMGLNVTRYASGVKGGKKIPIRRTCRIGLAVEKNGRIVGVYGYNWPETVV